jgi:polyferredoxin
MTEEKDRSETTTETEEEQSPSAEEVKTVKAEKPTTTTKRKLSNPLGIIFNIRMLRRVVQVFFLLIINAYIFAAAWGQEAITQFWADVWAYLPTLPILAPLEGEFAIIAGSFDTMQREFTSGLFPFFTLGAMIIILTVLGRSACGWVCPIGTIQDFATLPNRSKIRPSQKTEDELRKMKGYIFILVLFLIVWVGFAVSQGSAANLMAVLGPFANAPFDQFNPAYILFVILPQQNWPTGVGNLWLLTTWGIVWLQVGFVVLILVVSYWFPRWFCRWLCPAGWLYGIFGKESLVGIGRNPARCTPDVCNTCEVVCPMNIRIRRFPYQRVHSSECIMCLECRSHCPNNAIEIKFL